MLTPEIAEARKTGIGGSDLAALLELSKWRTRLDVYLEKIGEGRPFKESKRMRRGHAIEPLLIQKFSERWGVKVERLAPMLRHPEHPFMLANLDGRIPGAIVEAKIAWNDDEWGEDGSDEVPPYYQTQACHYMAVTGEPLCHFPVLFGMDGLDWEFCEDSRYFGTGFWTPKIADDADFRVFTIPRDDTFVSDVIEAEHAFWHEHVLPRVPPAPISKADAAKIWKRDNGRSIEVMSDVAEKVAQLKDVRARQKEFKAAEDALVDELAVAFGEHLSMLYNGVEIANYKHQKRAGYTVQPTEFRVMRLK